jgi:hypothetical protein
MSTITFDTDDLIQKLVQKQIPEEHARAIVKAIVEAQRELCTKDDLTALEHRMVIKLGSICAASITIAVAISAWLQTLNLKP